MEQQAVENIKSYESIRGIFPTKQELILWGAEDFRRYMAFQELFYNPERKKLNVGFEKIQEVEAGMRDPNCTYADFMYRIDRWCVVGDRREEIRTQKSFQLRMATFTRIVFDFIKENPHVLSDEVKEWIADKPQFKWYGELFKVVETGIGASVVENDTSGMSGMKIDKNANADKLMLESLVKLSSLYNTIAGSFNQKELRSLPVRDRLNALQKLSFIFSATKNYKPNNQVFQQINVFKAGREELEKALLDFGEE